MFARAAVLIALVLALAAAGCGGSDDGRDTYVKSLNKAQTGLQQRFTQLGARITPTSSAKQDQRTLEAYESAVGTTVKDLRAIDPPSGFETLHSRFIGQVAGYGAALRTARSRIDSDDPRAILAAQGRLKTAVQQTGQRLNATIEAINKKLKG
ncbi:hypothetical protein DSM104299_00826 [Baekduia alba]|uniref:hypothetical protein n=1 Tax=Baekduia alba TaxID=2997333 RepID=UPI002340BD85|nr:hypothetical protein [Baekduia alba]WCB92141.1 hypothetical protein DSM104299_00826 [Baekduia alba]